MNVLKFLYFKRAHAWLIVGDGESFLFLHDVCPALLFWEVEIEGWLRVDGHVEGTQGMVVWGRDVVVPGLRGSLAFNPFGLPVVD